MKILESKIMVLEKAQIEGNDEITIGMAKASQQCGNFVGKHYSNWCQAYQACEFKAVIYVVSESNDNSIVEHNIAGYALLIVPKPGLVEIFDVCFVPKYRGLGYAKETMNYIVSWCKAYGYASWLCVKMDNPFYSAAIKTYIRAGYIYNMKAGQHTMAGADMGFPFIGLELAAEVTQENEVETIYNNSMEMVHSYYLSKGEYLFTFIIDETAISEMRSYTPLDREWGGNLSLTSTGSKHSYNLQISHDYAFHTDIPYGTSNHANKCSLEPLGISNVMFHTHFDNCVSAEGGVLNTPSGYDMSASLVYSLYNAHTPSAKNAYMHMVVTGDGLYSIRVKEDFSERIRAYFLTHPPDVINRMIETMRNVIRETTLILGVFIFASAATKNITDMLNIAISGFNGDPKLSKYAHDTLIQSVQSEEEHITLYNNRPAAGSHTNDEAMYLKFSKDIILRFFLTIYNNMTLDFIVNLAKSVPAFKAPVDLQTLETIANKSLDWTSMNMFEIKLNSWPTKGKMLFKESISINNNNMQ